MPITTTKAMLEEARAGRYAIGAFNFENMEMALAIVAAAEKMRSPVILQTTPTTIKYGGLEVFAALARAVGGGASVPVALHLDHGDGLDLVARALEAGYTSVMMDASQHPLEENIAISRKAADLAHSRGVPVEAELGKVGGKEDNRVAAGDGPGYADPAEAVRFVRETGVDSLAIGIGTAHGFYKGTPVLAMDVLDAVHAGTSIPLVLHGASGLPEADVRACVKAGICKVNFATELRAAYTDATRDYLSANPQAFDPKKYGQAARERVFNLVCDRIGLCLGR